MVKPPAKNVDAMNVKGFVWMWFIKVYRCQKSAIYSLNVDLALIQPDYNLTITKQTNLI